MNTQVHARAFGELAEFRNGVNFSAESRGAGELAVIGVGDFRANYRLADYSRLERIARPKSLDDDALLRDGDLVFVRSNGNKELIGRCMVLESVCVPVTHSGFTIRARLTTQDVSSEWIAQYFASGLAKRAIMKKGGGTNISNLSQKILHDLSIPVPEPAYQRRVLNIAREFTRSIQQLDEALSAKRAFKRGLNQQLLTGRMRFPEFRDRPWIKSAIGDVFEEATRSVSWNENASYTLVSVRRRSGGLFLRERKKGADIKVKALNEIREGDILISTRQVVHGAIARVPSEFDGAHVSGEYMVLVPKSGAAILPQYFDHLTRLPRMYHISYLASYGVDIEKLTFNPEWYLASLIDLPPTIQEQQRIADVLDAQDRELQLLAAQRKMLESMRRAVLSKLLSGEFSLAV